MDRGILDGIMIWDMSGFWGLAFGDLYYGVDCYVFSWDEMGKWMKIFVKRGLL
jgi:hypothetical protein